MTNLDRTWKNCLRMWKWVTEQKKARPFKSMRDLKIEWLAIHGFKRVILCNCFFCECAGEKGAEPDCRKCPGKQVSRRFHCERYSSYHWQNKPKAFYRKLLELDKKRNA